MFDNLFVHFGPLGTSAALLFVLCALTISFSIGKHLRGLREAR
jgi:hypothetical protein